VLIDTIPSHERHLADSMLAKEIERQARLKAVLAADPKTARWIEERALFRNYKRLQFFDTLALYFNRSHEDSRAEMRFEHVPMNDNEDVTVAIRPVEKGVYSLSPYPMARQGAEFSFPGRYIDAMPSGTNGNWTEILAARPTERQHLRLVAA